MDSQRTPKQRPYWHVDAKWVTGLLLTFVLGLALLVYNLYQITAEEPAIDAVSMALALLFSPDGLDDETGMVEVRQKLSASPDGSIQPIPGLQITIAEEDIAGLSAREARLSFFRQLAEPLYREGPQGLSALADDPETRESMAAGVGPLGLFTRQAHDRLRGILTVLGAISLVLLLPLIRFSYRFGRLGSPGCVLFVASLPGALFFTFLRLAARPMTAPPAEEAGISGMIGYMASNLLPPLLKIVSRNYVMFLAAGLGIMALAILGSMVWRLARRARPAAAQGRVAFRDSHQPAAD